ncbi:hypothetical protein [Nocardioides bruguierae]|uniref:hypothetical protein n=1 Tax=Nocardioides bruguierae TaxID=2945102 RepID=UPI002021026B|nr:hypothetical protein [Nocardioides bruguierae]MCL8026297.1 hypothetical protein [Nocardioides bruguierae]
MILRLMTRPADDTTAEAREITVETDDYGTGLEQARAQVPDGWVPLGLTVQR